MTTFSPLRFAIMNQNPASALEIMRTDPYLDIEDDESNLILAMMWLPHDTDLMEPLIAGRTLNALQFRNSQGHTPLMIAASLANVVAINLLAKAGINVNEQPDGWTPLSVLVLNGLLRIKGMYDDPALAHAQVLKATRALVRAGANVNADPPFEKTLLRAYIKEWEINGGNLDLVRFLVAEGAVAPSKEELQQINPKYAIPIHDAKEQGLTQRALANELREAMSVELVTLISDYLS